MLNNRLILSVVTVISVTFLFTTTLLADPPENKGKPEKTNSEEWVEKNNISVDANLSVVVSAGINIGDARKLASKYELTGQKSLPQGIRKNLARGKPMPPGIQTLWNQ